MSCLSIWREDKLRYKEIKDRQLKNMSDRELMERIARKLGV